MEPKQSSTSPASAGKIVNLSGKHAGTLIKDTPALGPVPKWGLYFYWGRGITRVGFNRPLYAAHVDASD